MMNPSSTETSHHVRERDFSEDEEEQFVVATSESELEEEDHSLKEKGAHQEAFKLGNVTLQHGEKKRKEVYRFRWHANHQSRGTRERYELKEAGKALVLFDLNGVLVHHRYNGVRHVHTVRPGLESLLRLKEKYDVGIYSSATERTVRGAVGKMLHMGVSGGPTNKDHTQYGGQGGDLHGRVELRTFGDLFDVMLCRDHCVLATDVGIMREDGKPWDTVKPLKSYFGSHGRVILIDDSKHKSFPGEEEQMIVIPTWEGHEHDDVLEMLVESLMAMNDHDEFSEFLKSICIIQQKFNAALQAEEKETRDRQEESVHDDIDQGQQGMHKVSDAHTMPYGTTAIENGQEDSGTKHNAQQTSEIGRNDGDLLLPVYEDRGQQSLTLAVLPSKRQDICSTKYFDTNEKEKQSWSTFMPPISSPQKTMQPYAVSSYSLLHHQLQLFAEKAAPTPSEVTILKEVVTKIEQIARSLWNQSQAVIFGSQAVSLALPGADVDVAIIGIGPNMKSASSGFSNREKGRLGALLKSLAAALIEQNVVVGTAEVIDARVPRLKFNTRVSNGQLLAVDVSIGTENGIAAVEFLRKNVVAIPPLRPLILFIKALLREKGLNEVFTGGLGSYAILNMVMAHLQGHGYTVALSDHAAVPIADGQPSQSRKRKQKKTEFKVNKEPFSLDNDMTFDFVQSFGQNWHSNVGDHADLGILLWSLLDFFGNKFDYYTQAVSVLQGGIIGKGSWIQPSKPWLLAVEDPQDAGREICGGSFRITDVKNYFSATASSIAEACELESVAGTPNSSRMTRHGEDLHDSIIATVLDIDLALGRDSYSCKKRHDVENAGKLHSKYLVRGNSTKLSRSNIHKVQNKLGVKKPKMKRKPGKKTPKALQGKSGLRGSKKGRAVEAQWQDTRGQHFETGEGNNFPRSPAPGSNRKKKSPAPAQRQKQQSSSKKKKKQKVNSQQ